MKNNLKKVLFSSIITLLVSAGFAQAANGLAQHVDATPSAQTVADHDMHQQVPPCDYYQK